jgi:asparagine synthase (glutamine-hydrolysing)
MCGIAGFFGQHDADKMSYLATAMAERIAYRGPDDFGVWVDADAGIALAHRRLAIVDLSPAGHQPMLSESGRFVLVFNGEIYNHLELRAQLSAAGTAPAWRGHSDTETLLAAIEAWGLCATLKACVGMFAIALWDKQEQTLTLARDRFGEKPLYYGWQNGVLLFGSELKAIGAHPCFERRVNRNAVAQLLRYNYIPAPHSIWQGIHKLPQATTITVRIGQTDAVPEAYWSLAAVAENGQKSPFTGTESEAVEALQNVLTQSIRGQMLADVPLGALLSGGIDSSMVVALMQSQSDRPVKTYSIGFHEKQFDESGYARDVAKHLGSEHTELYMGAKDVLNAVPNMPSMYDEPFADSSQLPTSLVMALARQHVTVALSGDGGDELFGGYNRYLMAPKVWKAMQLVPAKLRGPLGKALQSVSPQHWDKLAKPFASIIKQNMVGSKVHNLSNRLINVKTFDDLIVSLTSEWNEHSSVVSDALHTDSFINQPGLWPDIHDQASRIMFIDSMTYMPDDILVKVDRAAMAVSLETRAPFLDHRVAELAWTLPISMKIRNGNGKHVLRQVLYKYVPQHLIDRPKMGFAIPLDQWLREDLRDWAEALLAPERLKQEGYFDAAMVREAWDAHLSGARNYSSRLWSVLMFQAWLQEQG